MSDLVTTYKCADGTDFPVTWKHEGDADLTWGLNDHHFPDPLRPLDTVVKEGTPARERAFSEAGLPIPTFVRRFLVPHGFVYIQSAGFTGEGVDAVGSPDLGDAFRAPLETDVPVLLISGELDARTPVGNAEEVLHGLVNGQHIMVEGASHSMFQEAWPQILPVIMQFIQADPFEPVTSTRITAPFEFEQTRPTPSN